MTSGRIYVNESLRRSLGDRWNELRSRAFAAGVYLTTDPSNGAGEVSFYTETIGTATGFLYKKRGEFPPRAKTRFSRHASDYDLHEMAGGLPLQSLAVPNVRRTSKRRREVYNPERKSNIPYK